MDAAPVIARGHNVAALIPPVAEAALPYLLAITDRRTLVLTPDAARAVALADALEGLWWGPDRRAPFSVKSPKDWHWKVLIRTPVFVAAADLTRAKKALLAKGKVGEIAKVKLETIKEGRCVQMLHVGGYDKEPATIEAMLAFAEERDLAFRGVHHEIYLSDPRRTPPARLRTILRHQVR